MYKSHMYFAKILHVQGDISNTRLPYSILYNTLWTIPVFITISTTQTRTAHIVQACDNNLLDVLVELLVTVFFPLLF